MKKSEKIKTKKFLINIVNMEINDIYKCSGKKYNGEKAIISITSWKDRIGTVGKTLFSLIKQCPGFHIVLVLSEEEFPKMEEELPEELMLFVNNNLIELLWVYKNYKVFKKVLFTMNKYKKIPIITTDDDCLFTGNFAEILYKNFIKNKSINTYSLCYKKEWNLYWSVGQATIFPPNSLTNGLIFLENKNVINTNHDDLFLGLLAKKNKIKIFNVKNLYKQIKTKRDNTSMVVNKLYNDEIGYMILFPIIFNKI